MSGRLEEHRERQREYLCTSGRNDEEQIIDSGSLSRRPHALAGLNFDPNSTGSDAASFATNAAVDTLNKKSHFEKHRHSSVGNGSIKLAPENFIYGLNKTKHTTPSRNTLAKATQLLSRQKSLAKARKELNGEPSTTSLNLASQSFLPRVKKVPLNNMGATFKYTVRDLSNFIKNINN